MPVAVVSEFFRTMLASGSSVSSLRSYGLALLRWWAIRQQQRAPCGQPLAHRRTATVQTQPAV